MSQPLAPQGSSAPGLAPASLQPQLQPLASSQPFQPPRCFYSDSKEVFALAVFPLLGFSLTLILALVLPLL